MRSSIYRLAMLGAMLIVVLNTYLALRALRALFDAQNWRAHTFEVLLHTQTLDDDVNRATAATRAFILTGNSLYENRFYTFSGQIDAEVANLRRLTPDNDSQQHRLDFTRTRLAVRTAVLQEAIAMRKASGDTPSPVQAMAELADSPDGGPTVAYCLTQIENEENRLLADRTHASDEARRTVVLTFVVDAVLALLLLGATAELLIRTLRDRAALAASAQEVQNLNADLRLANSSLEERVDQRTRELANTNKELEAFSYSVSHDLRAPLRTIDGFSLALFEDYADKLDDAGRDYIARVRGGVQRMGQLIDALLQLSRVTRADLQFDTVDLSQIAQGVFEELKAAEPARQITFTAQPGVVTGDGRLLRVALENLMGNAFKFTSKTPDARISFGSMPGGGAHAGRTVYFIRDNGAGFDMQYVDRLFTAFQRLHGDRDFKGSGIGLATVSRIISRHHGNIWAEGEPGRGAAFSFTLGTAPEDTRAAS
jgi:signal transduction histidine kinase